MDPVLKKEWVKALRSGKYEQGQERLQTLDGTFCCLGVLCDVFKDLTGDGQWNHHALIGNSFGVVNPNLVVGEEFLTDEEFVTEAWEEDEGHLPVYVRQIAGITDAEQENLIIMNDSGERSFDDIADYIEETL